MSAELVPIADGVFCWEHDVHDRLASNVGVVVGDDGLTLIDSGGLPESYRPLAERLKRFGRPVSQILLTHDHPDHVGGAGAGAFGDAPIRASPATINALAADPPIDALQLLHPTVADQIDTLRNPTAVQALTNGERLGRMRVQLLGGHTSSDVVVHVDDADVVFAGDLCFFGVVPLGLSADFARWQQSLSTIVSGKPGCVVPGHGAPGTIDDVAHLSTYLDAIGKGTTDRDDDPHPPDGFRAWVDLWHDRIPHATHRMNLEHARDPARFPETLLALLRPDGT